MILCSTVCRASERSDVSPSRASIRSLMLLRRSCSVSLCFTPSRKAIISLKLSIACDVLPDVSASICACSPLCTSPICACSPLCTSSICACSPLCTSSIWSASLCLASSSVSRFPPRSSICCRRLARSSRKYCITRATIWLVTLSGSVAVFISVISPAIKFLVSVIFSIFN